MSIKKPWVVPESVANFIQQSSSVYGAFKTEEFAQFMWTECCSIESPIEQLFLVAVNLVAEVNLVPVAVGVDIPKGDDHPDSLVVVPQWSVGKYRVDFALRRPPIEKIVVVELDGHEFHDRDERQRRYEKTRDRFFTASGYSVLHFTGAEIVRDPCAAALEAFNLATGLGHVAIHPMQGG